MVLSFPDRIVEEKMSKAKQLTLKPLPKKGKAEVWTLEDLESYREHFGREDLVNLKRRGTTPELQSEKEVKPEVSVPKSLSTDSTNDLGGDTTNEGAVQVEKADDDTQEAQSVSKVNDLVGVAPEPGVTDIQGGIDLSPALDPPPTNPYTLNKADILDEPDLPEEPQSIQATSPEPESDPESTSVIDSLEYLQDEHAAEQSIGADMDPANLSQEQDEELERAMQYFNLGMWHRPWRPPPRKAEEELEKEPEKELSKQLELQEKVEFNRTIHILGLGTVGKYIAHSLAGLPNGPPVTLLVHRPLLMQQWHDEGAAIRILINDEVIVQSGFHIESSANFPKEHPEQRFPGFGPNLEHTAEQPSGVIETLIVTTDPHTTLSALSSIRHRLRKSTTICFIQDGLGILEKINETIFPDPHERPTYILGRISHELASTERHFTIVEKKTGEISCSKLPNILETKNGYFRPSIKRKDFTWSPTARHLFGSLLRAPGLNTKSLGHKSFFRTQLEKLVVGAIIGPLSVAYDCSNGHLLYNHHVSKDMRYLLGEISDVVQSLPELETINLIEKTFSVDRLERIIVSCLKTSRKNVSSMLQDVRAGKKTDIDFYNGYLLLRAKELGIYCPRNHMLIRMVKGKQAIESRKKNLYIPFEDKW